MAENNAINSPKPFSTTDGGTGVSNPTANGVLIGNGASPITSSTLTDGQLLIGRTGMSPLPATLAAGSGISIANGSGSITITSTAASFPILVSQGGTGATTAEGARQNLGINYGNHNFIINPNMQISERGTSFPAISDGDYSLDRYRYTNTSAAVSTISQSTTAPQGSANSLLVTITTDDATVGAADSMAIGQRISAENCQVLDLGMSTAQTVTLSFWVRSSKVGTYCVAFQNAAQDRSYVTEYTINVANTFEKKIVTLTLDTTGTWATTGTGLSVLWTLMAGTNFQGSPNTWAASNIIATSNQVNFADTIGATFYVTQVQLELGDHETSFQPRLFEQEKYACGQYYSSIPISIIGVADTTSIMVFTGYLGYKMNSIPNVSLIDNSVTVLRPNTGALVTSAASAITSSFITNSGFNITINGFGGALVGGNTYFAQQSSPFLAFEAEL